MSTRSREALVSEMAATMRLFMTHAVLFQDAVAEWAGLNSVDLQCAGLLMLEGPQTPSELARRTGISPGGAITAVVDRLEAAGLVHRTRDSVDRRRVLVTPQTDVLMQRVAPAYGARHRALERLPRDPRGRRDSPGDRRHPAGDQDQSRGDRLASRHDLRGSPTAIARLRPLGPAIFDGTTGKWPDLERIAVRGAVQRGRASSTP